MRWRGAQTVPPPTVTVTDQCCRFSTQVSASGGVAVAVRNGTSGSEVSLYTAALPGGCITAGGGGGFNIANLSISLSLLNFDGGVTCPGPDGADGADGADGSDAGALPATSSTASVATSDAAAVWTGVHPHSIDWRSFAPRSGGELGVGIGATGGKIALRRFQVGACARLWTAFHACCVRLGIGNHETPAMMQARPRSRQRLSFPFGTIPVL